jgi:hypothetical protein
VADLEELIRCRFRFERYNRDSGGDRSRVEVLLAQQKRVALLVYLLLEELRRQLRR